MHALSFPMPNRQLCVDIIENLVVCDVDLKLNALLFRLNTDGSSIFLESCLFSPAEAESITVQYNIIFSFADLHSVMSRDSCAIYENTNVACVYFYINIILV